MAEQVQKLEPPKAAPPKQRQVAMKFSSGGPGTVFNIDGSTFGELKGRVLLGAREVEVTRWKDHSIKGWVPKDVKPTTFTVITAEAEVLTPKP